MRYNEVDESLKNEIVEEYLSGISIMKLHEKYGPCKKSISNLLKERGIKIRSGNDEIYQIKSPYHFNEYWLDELDCAEKFYFLGFFAADGYNRQSDNVSIIKLQKGDKELLEKFNKILGSDRPIYYGSSFNKARQKQQETVEIKFTSKYFCNRLAELGLPQAKTYIIQFPDYIPNEYMRDYIRGVLDGDGNISVSYANKTAPKGTCSICGMEQFLIPIADFLKNNLRVYVDLYKSKTCATSSLKINRQEDIKIFLDWLYKETTLYLQRKYDKYQEFLSVRDFSKETVGQKRRRIKSQEQDIINDYLEGTLYVSEIAKKFDCSDVTIYRVLDKHGIQSDRELKRLGKLDTK